MKLLAIDTSTSQASVALSLNSEFLTNSVSNVKEHALNLLPMINNLLDEAQLKIQDLDGIVFGKGPGSFTGLRIACGVAQGLAWAHSLPIYPVSTLSSIAHKIIKTENLPKNTKVLSVIDARMQQVYWAYFDNESNEFNVNEYVTNPKNILSVDAPVVLTGVGFDVYLEEFSAAIQKSKKIMQFPDAIHMIKLVKEGYVKEVALKNALPEYIRGAVTQ